MTSEVNAHKTTILLNKEEKNIIRLLRTMPPKLRKSFLQLLEKMEDVQDAADAEQMIKDIEAGKAKTQSGADVKRIELKIMVYKIANFKALQKQRKWLT